jgi:hypothetical protein
MKDRYGVTKDSWQVFALRNEAITLILNESFLYTMLEKLCDPRREPTDLEKVRLFSTWFVTGKGKIEQTVTVCNLFSVRIDFRTYDDFLLTLDLARARLHDLLERAESHRFKWMPTPEERAAEKRPKLTHDEKKEVLVWGFLLRKAVIAYIYDEQDLEGLPSRFNKWCEKESPASLPKGK